MPHPRKPISRRTLLRGAMLGSTGLAAAAIVGCGDDDDAASSGLTVSPSAAPATTITATPSPALTPTPAPAGHFALVSGWYRGTEVKYYDFGTRSQFVSATGVLTAPAYAFITGMDADGNPVFVPGQHHIIDVRPGDNGYSDLWQVNLVTVDDAFEPDSLRSRNDIREAGLAPQPISMFVNRPVVPAGSTLERGEMLVQGWYKGEEIFYADFGPNPATALPMWAFISGMDATGNPVFVEGQMNIIDSVPGDEGYSAFWDVNLVTVPDDYQPNTLTSASDILAAGYDVAKPIQLVNCPVTVF